MEFLAFAFYIYVALRNTCTCTDKLTNPSRLEIYEKILLDISKPELLDRVHRNVDDCFLNCIIQHHWRTLLCQQRHRTVRNWVFEVEDILTTKNFISSLYCNFHLLLSSGIFSPSPSVVCYCSKCNRRLLKKNVFYM